jgi:hypothetical protein
VTAADHEQGAELTISSPSLADRAIAADGDRDTLRQSVRNDLSGLPPRQPHFPIVARAAAMPRLLLREAAGQKRNFPGSEFAPCDTARASWGRQWDAPCDTSTYVVMSDWSERFASRPRCEAESLAFTVSSAFVRATKEP